MTDTEKNASMVCPKCGANLKIEAYNDNYDQIVCPYCDYKRIDPKRKSTAEQMDHEEKIVYAKEKGYLRANDEIEEVKKARTRKRIAFALISLLFVVLVFNFIEKLNRPKADPFAYVTIQCSGIDGHGKCEMKLGDAKNDKGEVIDTSKIKYQISKTSDFSNNDTLTITAESDTYQLTEKSKVYTVSGLDEYLKNVDELSQDNIDLLVSEAIAKQPDATKNGSGATFNSVTAKKLIVMSGNQTSTVYVISEINYTLDDGTNVTYYLSAYFKDVVLRKNSNGEYSLAHGESMHAGNMINLIASRFIYGYASQEAAEAAARTTQTPDADYSALDLH